MVMKMQEPELAFVDGLYAKFYSLPSELLRVGPKCSSPLQDLIPSILPKQSRGKKSSQCPASDCGLLLFPPHAPPERE